MNIQIRAGDTLAYYSQLLQIPLILLLDSNPNTNPSNLVPGETIRIPGYSINYHTVKQGDSLWKISQQHNISPELLSLTNPGLDPAELHIGQKINLPTRITSLIVDVKRKYDYTSSQQDLNRLTAAYPFIVRRQAGYSAMGKTIHEIQIGRGEKRVHMNASFHANEWITSTILIQTLNAYLLAMTNNSTLGGIAVLPFYRSVYLSAVPMVNPDGVDLVIHGAPAEEPYRTNVLTINRGKRDFSLWKANIRGVDLNNQFPALWQEEAAANIKQPAPRDFPGYAPLSEPESIAMANLTREENFSRVLAYHTQGQVIYWGFEGLEPPESETIVREFARVSGYAPIRYVSGSAGYKDWFIQDWRRPGFTIELGKGTNPLPLSQFDSIYQANLGIFLASLYM